LYSEDVVSAKDGGALGFLNREDLVPAFSAVAFGLKGKEVSPIVETEFGFHIIQLIERRGEQVNVRHILMSPKVSAADLQKSQLYLDSIADLIMKDSISFADAALKFSSDEQSRNNGGLMVNPQTNSTRFETDEIDPTLFFVVDKMKVGEISKPVLMQTPEGKKAYRLLYLKTRTSPHRANLTDDYQKIQAAALTEMQGKEMDAWIKSKMKNIFIQLSDDYKTCKFNHQWYQNN
jgi:peptidyl-prolyl cis-trans isomerase SurA